MVGMEEKHRKLLRSNRMDLVRDMDGERVASFLYSSEILSEEDRELVNAETTPQRKNEKLLDILPKRGGKAFAAFCDTLRELKLFHLEVLLRHDEKASALIEAGRDEEDKSAIDGRIQETKDGDLKGNPEKQTAVESEEKKMESDGPHAGEDQGDGRFFGKSDKKDASPQPMRRLPSLKGIDYHLDSDTYYPMDKYPRGLFLLLNNKEFLPASGMENYPRNGTGVDADALEQLFTDLGFIVHRYNNVSCHEMRKLCKQAALMDYSNLGCFTCAILSHGQEGVIYGTDGTVDIRELTGYFRGRNLSGKPKMFLFQACQGSDYMESVDVTDGAPDDRTNEISLPSESDFIYGYSTVPGYYSWRNSQRGSWFVQAIVEVFRAHAHKMDVLRMLTRANAIVATKKSATGQRVSNNKRQIASIVTQLRKEFFLFPPQGPLNSV
eukprot:Seg3242.2 transcript_id=Seg3242.2/GoldUCD/mRNA.D3Y31 product=Caspase-3 protein_id=Seg3242.2/GoldUCD/D3Y31